MSDHDPAGVGVDAPGLPHRERRTRSLLVLVIVASVCLSYLAGWMYWAQVHVVVRHEQVPPGATVTEQGIELTLTSLVRTSVLEVSEEEADSGVEEPVAPPNTVYVVARVEAVATDEADPEMPLCTFKLLGPDDRTWEYDGIGGPERGLPSTCSDAPLNQPYELELIYVIPEKYADQIGGLSVVEYKGAPEKVLRPPEG